MFLAARNSTAAYSPSNSCCCWCCCWSAADPAADELAMNVEYGLEESTCCPARAYEGGLPKVLYTASPMLLLTIGDSFCSLSPRYLRPTNVSAPLAQHDRNIWCSSMLTSARRQLLGTQTLRSEAMKLGVANESTSDY